MAISETMSKWSFLSAGRASVAAVALGTVLMTSVIPVWGEPDLTFRGDARVRSIMRWNHDFNSSNGPSANRRVAGDESFVDHRERLSINGKVGDDFEAMFQWNVGDDHQLGSTGTAPTQRPSVTTMGDSVRQLWVDVRFPFAAPLNRWHLRVGRQFIDFGQGLVFGDDYNGTDSVWFYGPLGPGRLSLGFFQISEGSNVFDDDWRVYGAKYRWPFRRDHSIEPYFLYSYDSSNLTGPNRAGECRQPTSPSTALTSAGLVASSCQDETKTWFLGAGYEGRMGTTYGDLRLWFDGAYQGGERVFQRSTGAALLTQTIDAQGVLAGVELNLRRRTTRGIPIRIGLEGGYGSGHVPQPPNATGLDPSTNTHFGIMSSTNGFPDRFPGLSNYQFGNFIDEALQGNGPDTLSLGGGAATPTGGAKRTRAATFNGVSNQYVVMPKVVVRPTEQIEIDLRWARHWAVEPSSAASIANNFLDTPVPVRNPDGTLLDSHLGDDVGVIVNWFAHKNVVVTGYFLWFFPGNFFKVSEAAGGTTTGAPDTAQTIRLEIVGRF